MKLVSAIVRPFKLDEVRKALAAHEVQSLQQAAFTGKAGDGSIFVMRLCLCRLDRPGRPAFTPGYVP